MSDAEPQEPPSYGPPCPVAQPVVTPDTFRVDGKDVPCVVIKIEKKCLFFLPMTAARVFSMDLLDAIDRADPPGRVVGAQVVDGEPS